jgi:hypothetical protein
MADALLAVEWVLAVFVLLAVVSVAYVWLRRRHIAQGRTLLVGAMRTSAEPRWRLGLIRLRGDRFEWFSVVGPRWGPERTWLRHDLDLGAPQRLTEEIPGLPGAVAVGTGRHETELALTPSTYTAVRAWHESSPPGFNVNVA